MPTRKSLSAMRICLLLSNWLESDFQVYCSRSKRIKLPNRSTIYSGTSLPALPASSAISSGLRLKWSAEGSQTRRVETTL